MLTAIKKTPHNPVELWGKRMNSSSPRSAVRAQRKTFPPREEWHVRARCWHQRANQGRIVCQGQRPRQSRRSPWFLGFVTNISPAYCCPRIKKSGNKKKRVERSPPDVSFDGMIEITKLVHFSVAAMNIPHHNVTIGADDCITAT